MTTKEATPSRALAASRTAEQALITDQAAHMTREQVDLLKRTFCAQATDDELRLFLHFCARNEADPLNREAWFQVRKSKVKDPETDQWHWERRPVFGLGIDGIRKRLTNQPDFAGIESAVVYQKDQFSMDAGTGEISHKILTLDPTQRGTPIAAWCRITRKDKQPLVRMVLMRERCVPGNPSWDRMPNTMLQKCAEMDAIRAAYPDKFAGVYAEEEMVPTAEEVGPPIEHPKLIEVPDPMIVPTPTTSFAEAVLPPEPLDEKGPLITPAQYNQIKVWMQEFKLSGQDMNKVIEHEFGGPPAALARIPKPVFQKLAILFGQLRKGEVDFKNLKFIRPPEVLNEEAKQEDIPF